MRPEGMFDKIGSALGFQDIDFESHELFSRSFVLQGSNEEAIRQYFDQSVLDFFAAKPGISVEAPQRATVVMPQKPLSTPEASLTPASQIVEAGLTDEGDDGLIRSAVARLSSHPEFTSYLVNDRLLRRFVLSVDAIDRAGKPSRRIEADRSPAYARR